MRLLRRRAHIAPGCPPERRYARLADSATLGPHGSTGMGPLGPSTQRGPSAKLPMRRLNDSKLGKFQKRKGSTFTDHPSEAIPLAITTSWEAPPGAPNGTLNVVL